MIKNLSPKIATFNSLKNMSKLSFSILGMNIGPALSEVLFLS